ncbi:heavy-metal-associated domain-containing protein [Sulfobacillus sp. hq2]|uniref:heavy-metal-associated domain-containing protein n=1 Tax=Sulfobacillus sp. hq2 TaxID=2039167 RepID=UPI000CD17587|nr:copper ion binding protein [Sulfobacillus sp. hq2]POB11576.1 heavy metal-binding domain-containing protein [Sulfobacillus sp. hq2]
MERITLGVKGMTCNHCVMTVTNALKEVDGVKAANVSLEQEDAKITFDESKTNIDAIKKAVIDAGYQPE